MDEIMFIFFRLILLIVIAVLTRYIIPYLQKLSDKAELGYLRQVASDAVVAAEQTVSVAGSGIEKKEIVTKFIKNMLIKKNISISDQQLDSLIESAVYMLNANKPKKEEKSNE